MNKTRLIIGISLISFLLFASCATDVRSAPMSEDYNQSGLTETAERTGYLSENSPNETERRMVAYSVSMELSVEDIEKTRILLTEQVSIFNGYITRDNNNAIVMRIPSEKMDDFLTAVRELGKVENESKTGVDITEQHRDNIIRLESLKNVRERYLALLGRANTVNEILSIERELERINSQIELMEGRIKNAETSVAYSNITIRFSSKSRPGPVGWLFVGLYRGIRWLFVWN